MNINFDTVISSLREIGYAGDLTFEADAYLGAHYDANTAFEGIRNMAQAAKKLKEMFLAKQTKSDERLTTHRLYLFTIYQLIKNTF